MYESVEQRASSALSKSEAKCGAALCEESWHKDGDKWLAPRKEAAAAPTEYNNARFGFHLALPAGVFVADNFQNGSSSDNGDGIVCHSRDGKAELRAWGSHDIAVFGLNARAALARTIDENPDWQVVYKNQTAGGFEICGFDGKNAFYQKTLLKGDESAHVLIEYDKTQKKTYEPVCREIAKSLAV